MRLQRVPKTLSFGELCTYHHFLNENQQMNYFILYEIGNPSLKS